MIGNLNYSHLEACKSLIFDVNDKISSIRYIAEDVHINSCHYQSDRNLKCDSEATDLTNDIPY